jgi:hypothetical protein
MDSNVKKELIDKVNQFGIKQEERLAKNLHSFAHILKFNLSVHLLFQLSSKDTVSFQL